MKEFEALKRIWDGNEVSGNDFILVAKALIGLKKIEGYINNDDIIPELKVEIIKNILNEVKENE